MKRIPGLKLKTTNHRMINTKAYRCCYYFALAASMLLAFLCLADQIVFRISGFHYILVYSNRYTGAKSWEEINEFWARCELYERWYTPVIQNALIVLCIADIYLFISQATEWFRWHHIVLIICLVVFCVT